MVPIMWAVKRHNDNRTIDVIGFCYFDIPEAILVQQAVTMIEKGEECEGKLLNEMPQNNGKEKQDAKIAIEFAIQFPTEKNFWQFLNKLQGK